MDLDENCKPVDILVLDQNCSKEKCELYGEIIEHYPRRPRISQQIAISELDHSKSGTNWCIKALVVNKSSVRTYFGDGGEGCVFSLELCDESSSIQMVSFNEACHMFYSEIQANKMYYFRKCKIRDSNRRYNALPHKFELVLEKYSCVEPCDTCEAEIKSPPVKLWTLSEVVQEAEMLAMGKKHLKSFRVQGSIVKIEENNFVYEACPSEYCNKKVDECITDVGVLYHCMKCEKYYPTFEYRYVLKVDIADSSRGLRIALFDEAERFLNISAHDLLKMRESNYEEFESYFTKRIGEIHNFTLQAGLVLHEDNVYFNATCDSLFPADSMEPSFC